jgi:hypothetical protein
MTIKLWSREVNVGSNIGWVYTQGGRPGAHKTMGYA